MRLQQLERGCQGLRACACASICRAEGQGLGVEARGRALGSDFCFVFPDLCQWSPWGPWSPCQVPCSGGFRLRWREAGAPAGGGCRGPWAQTESCNTGPCPGNPPVLPHTSWHLRGMSPCCLCPWRHAVEGRALSWGPGMSPALTPTSWSSGESCEARDTVLTLGCANRCPRSCVDLWDRVQCLQGPCRPGGQARPAARPGSAGGAGACLPSSCSPRARDPGAALRVPPGLCHTGRARVALGTVWRPGHAGHGRTGARCQPEALHSIWRDPPCAPV